MTLITLMFCFFILQEAYGVNECYNCMDQECKNNPVPIKICAQSKPDTAYLCQILINSTSNEEVRSCIENNGSNIGKCDQLNNEKNIYCEHCDRELCNYPPHK